MPDVRISVIISAYNADKFLSRTIDSVLAQTFKQWELVIVNDGSTDKTSDIIASYANSHSQIRGISQSNMGCSGARNTGISYAQETPYIIFLDSDDVWEPHALSTLHDALESEPQHIAAYGSSRYIDANDAIVRAGELEQWCRLRSTFRDGRIVSLGPDEPTYFNTLIVASCLTTPGVVLLRKEAIQRVVGFDCDLKHAEDYDFYIRVSRYGTLKFIDRVLLNYRLHDSNKSSHSEKVKAALNKITIKTRDSPENTPEQHKIAVASYAAIQRYRMSEKAQYIFEAVQQGDFPGAIVQLKYAIGHFTRLVQGRP